MAEQISGTAELASVELERLNLDEITDEILDELEGVYANSYHNTHMHKDLLEDIEHKPEIFQMFLARLHCEERDELNGKSGKIVAARVIETKEHPFINYLGYTPVHGKRFNVLPDFRGKGIGKQIIDAGKHYCFKELGLPVIFGESNELGAISMY